MPTLPPLFVNPHPSPNGERKGEAAAAAEQQALHALLVSHIDHGKPGNDKGVDSDAGEPDMWALPAIMSLPSGHRLRQPPERLPFNAIVARPVGKKESTENSNAAAALQKEWDRLRAIGCWNEAKVRPWSEVAKEARDKGEKTACGPHFRHMRRKEL